MPDFLTIRTATIADTVLLAELGATTFREAFAADNTEEDMDAYLSETFTTERVGQELSDPLATFLIAASADKMRGYAKLLRGEPDGCVTGVAPIELVRLYVRTASIGQGVGATLMKRCIEQAKEEGFRTLWLGVWERNFQAIAFYRKWGFQPVGTHIFQLGSDPQTDLILQLDLSE